MLSIILLILKIIGIAILVLLAILLLLILLVLFVPIRYRVTAEHGDLFVIDGGVSWLLHLIHARVHQSANNRRIWIRVLGILVYDSLRPPKNKKEKAKRKQNTLRNNSVSKPYSKDEVHDSLLDDKTDIKQESIKQESIKHESIKHESINKESIRQENAKSETVKHESISNQQLANKEFNNDDAKNKKAGFFDKIIEHIKQLKAKVFGIFRGIKNKLMELLHKLCSAKNKLGLVLDFIKDDINKEGFRYTYGSFKKLIKHILPRRIKSKLIFGTGDPCSTGQALGVFGILYSIYGDSLQITPDFENKIFKGSHYARGRIRIWTILIIVIKLLLDKRFKELKMNYQLLKEAL